MPDNLLISNLRNAASAILQPLPLPSATQVKPRRVFIPLKRDGQISDIDSYNAFIGFNALNDEASGNGESEPYKIEFYSGHCGAQLSCEDILIDGVQGCRRALRILGVPLPPPLDYPKSLTCYLGRTIRESTVIDLMERANLTP